MKYIMRSENVIRQFEVIPFEFHCDLLTNLLINFQSFLPIEISLVGTQELQPASPNYTINIPNVSLYS
jgi:hypothetical protein